MRARACVRACVRVCVPFKAAPPLNTISLANPSKLMKRMPHYSLFSTGPETNGSSARARMVIKIAALRESHFATTPVQLYSSCN